MRRGHLPAIITCCLGRRKTKKSLADRCCHQLSTDWKHPHRSGPSAKPGHSGEDWRSQLWPALHRAVSGGTTCGNDSSVVSQPLHICRAHMQTSRKNNSNARLWSCVLLSTNGGFGNDQVSCWEEISFLALRQKTVIYTFLHSTNIWVRNPKKMLYWHIDICTKVQKTYSETKTFNEENRSAIMWTTKAKYAIAFRQ